MPKTPSRPLFVPSKAVPDEEGWRLAHKASDTFDRSMRAAVTRATNQFRAQPVLRAFERSGSIEAFPWGDFETSLGENLESRFRKISRRVSKSTLGRIPGARFNPEELDPELERMARESAALIVDQSKRAAREGVLRLRGRGFTERQIAMRIRPLLGLNRRSMNAALNRAFAMEEAGFTPTQIQRELRKLGVQKLGGRGRTIARTEGLRAATRAQRALVQQAEQTGIIAGARRMWVATLDVTHVNCKAMDGQIVTLDQPFIDPFTGRTVMEPPLHQNCQCGVDYVVLEELAGLVA